MDDLRPILVAGCGSPERGDDAVGIAILRALDGRLPTGVRAFEAANKPDALLHRWTAYRRIILIDAVSTGAPPGTVHRWAGDRLAGLQPNARASTHGFSIPEVIRFAKALFGDETQVSVIGIELGSADFGSDLTAPVQCAIETAVRAVLEEVAQCTSTA